MKVGVSTWSLLGLDIIDAVRMVGDSGFDYIELWGEVPHAYPDWTDRRLLKDALSSYSLTVTMHAPFTDLNPASPFQPVKGAIDRTLSGFLKFAEEFGTTVVTVHPGSVHSKSMLQKGTEASAATIRLLLKEADGAVQISLENQSKGRTNYHFPLASTAESIEQMLTMLDEVNFTLDTGHAHSSGVDSVSLCDRFAGRIAEIHLSDNNGGSDDHMVPGAGNAPLKKVMDRLSSREILVCLELDPYRYTPEQVMREAVAFKTGV